MSLGKTIGQMDRLLKDFNHPSAARPDMAWDIANAPLAEPLTADIADHETRRLARYFLMQFSERALPVLRTLPKSIVHNDCHRYSVITDDPSTPTRVKGIIDFGDTVLSNPVCHLAVVLSDVLIGQDELAGAAASIVAGYSQESPLTESEIGILLYLIGARLAIYSARSAHAAKHDGANAHAQSKAKDVAGLLARLHPNQSVGVGRCDAPGVWPVHDPRRCRRCDRVPASKTGKPFA